MTCVHKRLYFPEFIDLVKSHNVLCISESHLQLTDTVEIEGYTFITNHAQYLIKESPVGSAYLFAILLIFHVKLLPSLSEYVLWLSLDMPKKTGSQTTL